MIFTVTVKSGGDKEQGRMPQPQVSRIHRKRFDGGVVRGSVAVAFFFKPAGQHQVADVFHHPPVLELKHGNLREKETHVEEHQPRKKAEDPGEWVVPEEDHPIQRYGNFFQMVSNLRYWPRI